MYNITIYFKSGKVGFVKNLDIDCINFIIRSYQWYSFTHKGKGSIIGYIVLPA